MLRVVLCDDEALARQRLQRLLQQLSDCQVVGEAATATQLLQNIVAWQADVVLLDIRMPGMDGMEVAAHLRQLSQPPAVIFCTAYDEHAVAAFGVQALDYLLKPIALEDLQRALARVGTDSRQAGSGKRQYISARTHRGLERVALADVRYFMASDRYVLLHHVNGELLINDTLRDLEQEFSGKFVRIHRNALVAIEHVGSLVSHMGAWYVTVQDIEEPLKVSRRHAGELRRLLQSL